ncbi:MAG: tRNA-dihydrouridine synthase family protein [Clostridia bacterium]|nr:tRNA-dihydrouridine synthase family protein [Clostridia bacterium]
MKLYFAPLEGVTTFTYRNTHNQMFGGCDAYFAPFITPSDIEKVSMKNLRDILPERNSEINLKIQVLTSRSDSFFKFVRKVGELGYREININLGCPSGTVIKKGRGSGFLRDTEGLDRFLDEIFSQTDLTVSVKTRIGFESGTEMEELLKIYNKYPISLLTVHPRTRKDYYSGEPDYDVFKEVYNESVNPVCFNGNVFSGEDYNQICSKFPELDGVMLGRGAIKNPAIFREIRGGEKLTTGELQEFSHLLMENYMEVLKSDYFTLNKLKEIWMYGMWNFPEEKKILKEIKKSTKLSDLERAIEKLPEIQ